MVQAPIFLARKGRLILSPRYPDKGEIRASANTSISMIIPVCEAKSLLTFLKKNISNEERMWRKMSLKTFPTVFSIRCRCLIFGCNSHLLQLKDEDTVTRLCSLVLKEPDLM